MNLRGKSLACLLAACCLALFAARAFADQHGELLDRGIRNSDPYAVMLMQAEAENRQERGELLQAAASVSPDLPAVYFELAQWSLFSFSPLNAIDYVIQGFQAYGRNFWWKFTFLASLLTGFLFSFLAANAVLVAIRFRPDSALLAHDLRERNLSAFVLLVLILTALAGPLALLGGLLVILGLYMRNHDRFIVYLYLCFLLISPFFLRASSFFINAFSSGPVSSVVEVNESRGNSYALNLLKDRNDYPSRFSYALALKREGFYDDALDIFRELAKQGSDPRIPVNLGNIYVGFYGFDEERREILDETLRYYFESLDMAPLALTYYNLSQVYREQFNFAKGNEHFNSAQSLDRDAVAAYWKTFGRSPNRLVADGAFSTSELWDYADGIAGKSSRFGLSVIPVLFLPAVALILAGVFLIIIKKQKHRAFSCQKCNVVLCTQCEKHLVWGQMCPQCYGSTVKLDALDVKDRVSRLQAIYDHQKKKRNLMKILSFILPGAAQIYAGRLIEGFLILWAFLFFVFLPLSINIFEVADQLFTHGFLFWGCLFSALVVYVLSILVTKQRITEGWL